MVFRPPSALMQKVARFKAIQFNQGKVLLWGVPCFVDPIYLQVYYYKLLESHTSTEVANRVRFTTAKFQAKIGLDIINKQFGYAESLGDKQKIFEFNVGQTEVLGLGQFKVTKVDFQNKIFILEALVSPFAEEYKKYFGNQKQNVDYWLMGSWSGVIESILEEECLCLGTNCIVSGAQKCEFMIKPLANWDKESPIFKANEFLLEKDKSFEELGAKMSSHLH